MFLPHNPGEFSLVHFVTVFWGMVQSQGFSWIYCEEKQVVQEALHPLYLCIVRALEILLSASRFLFSRLQIIFSEKLTHKVFSDWLKVKVTQWCPTVWNPMDCSLPGFSIHGNLQARILEWVAILVSRGSSQPRDCTLVSHIESGFFTV